MDLNKLVHETRGKCWHFWGFCSDKEFDYKCVECGEEADIELAQGNPDYENDMNACMELWEEANLREMRYFRGSPDMEPYWRVWSSFAEARADTPQLAIIRAFLDSKGVELPPSTQP